MARGTMHAQKPDGQRRRRNAPTHDTTTLVRDGEVRGPSLEELTGRAHWPERVIRWYETWRRVPMAQLFEDTDWQRLGLLAEGVEALSKRWSAATMSEIRMNEERFGATVVDRMRARMRVEDDNAEAAPVVQLVDKQA